MPKRLQVKHLIEVSKASARNLNNYKFGHQICSTSGLDVPQLIHNASVDRFKLAHEILAAARWAARSQKSLNRIVIARSYYAMYHAARAIVFHTKPGDDHESHADLPKHLPSDFPQKIVWENELKDARLERNRADYDPYPRTDRAFASIATKKLDKASEFFIIARQYLLSKGCRL